MKPTNYKNFLFSDITTGNGVGKKISTYFKKKKSKYN